MNFPGFSVAVWAPTFVEWMHPAAILCGIFLPLIRAGIMKKRGHVPCFQAVYAVHDVASGLALPSFFALALSGLSEEIAKHAFGHAMELAGFMGVIYTISAIFANHHSSGSVVALHTARTESPRISRRPVGLS